MVNSDLLGSQLHAFLAFSSLRVGCFEKNFENCRNGNGCFDLSFESSKCNPSEKLEKYFLCVMQDVNHVKVFSKPQSFSLPVCLNPDLDNGVTFAFPLFWHQTVDNSCVLCFGHGSKVLRAKSLKAKSSTQDEVASSKADFHLDRLHVCLVRFDKQNQANSSNPSD